MSKTAKTEDLYLLRGKSLWSRAASASDVNVHQLHSDQFIDFIKQIFVGLRASTRRLYLASARQLIDYKLANAITAVKIKEYKIAKEKLDAMQSSDFSTAFNNAKKLPARTSSSKAKVFSNATLKLLLDGYRKSSKTNIYYSRAFVWMFANSLVGLRPSEWRFASIENDYLQVRNAKNTNGRGNGELRHIDISKLLPQELDMIKKNLRFMSLPSKNEKTWEKYQKSCMYAMNRATREFLPKSKSYPTLYSARHQFAANVKAGGLDRSEVAALMGHASDMTATHHYGKKKHGSGSVRVSPIPEEVKTVRKVSRRISGLKLKPK